MKIKGYHIESRGQGPIIFSLHGFSQSLQTWENLDLSAYRLVMIDLIGFGKSDKPLELTPYQLPQILESLHAIFKKISDGQSYSILGYSMGGRLALQYALNYPDEPIRQLIIESASAGIQSSSERASRRTSDQLLAQRILDNGADWFAHYWGNVSLFDSQKSLDKDVQEKIYRSRAANSPAALANTLLATGQGELDYIGERIKEISCPILYVTGSLDVKYSQIAETIFAPLKNVSWVKIAQAGHNSHLEKPEIYKQLLLENLL